ncbi:MAG: biotin transporter BioY [Acidobacteriota bacterium]
MFESPRDLSKAAPRWWITPRVRRLLFLVLGVVLIALAAQVTVPMVPVPMTLQTWAVLVVGAVGGWRMALAVLAMYCLVAALGAPVLADGASGVDRLVGPTAGYIVGFFLAGAGVGLARVRRWAGRRLGRWTLAAAGGHLLILATGFAWLGGKIGWMPALEDGVEPFLLGAVAKSLLAALSIRLLLGLRRQSVAGRSGELPHS